MRALFDGEQRRYIFYVDGKTSVLSTYFDWEIFVCARGARDDQARGLAREEPRRGRTPARGRRKENGDLTRGAVRSGDGDPAALT